MTAMPTDRPLKSRLTLLQEFCLYGVFFFIPFFRLGTEVTGVTSLTPAKIFIGLTFLAWTATLLIKKDSGTLIFLLQEKANLFLLIFMVVTFMSLIFTRYIEAETVSELLLRVKMFLLYFLIIAIIKHRQTLKIAIAIFLLGSMITTGAGLYEAGMGKPFFKASYRDGDFTDTKEGLAKTNYSGGGRVQGLYSDAGFHAHAMVIFIGLAIPWAFYARTKKFRFIMGVLVLAYMVNLIGTGARVGWVSVGCALSVFFLFMQHRHKYTLWALSALAVILIFSATSLIPHLPTTERLHLKGAVSWSWRLETARQGFEMIRDHPILGIGTGNYLVEYFNYLENIPNLSRYRMGWLHNSYLQIWIENGIIGLLIFFAFLAAVGQGLLLVYLNACDKEMKVLALGLITAFVGYAVEFSGVPVIGQEMGWIVLSLSVALIAINRIESSKRISINHKYRPSHK